MPREQRKRPIEPWENLLHSANIYDDLGAIYTNEFLLAFAEHFDRAPHPVELMEGVFATARAYVNGKWRKQIERDRWRKYSGVNLIRAGLSARRLAWSLRQIGKSGPATDAVLEQLGDTLREGDRALGRRAYQSSLNRSGPATQLRTIQELVASLEDAISELIEVPEDPNEEWGRKPYAINYVNEKNLSATRTLTKNFPVEEAARVFRPVWEKFSTVPYRRGRYYFELGRYDCKAGDALHEILSRLDRSIAPSLSGTAIENTKTTQG